ncbi:MAG: hypothetical protein ACOCWO_03430 [Candidatus Muiribacteriaceae bacterium]
MKNRSVFLIILGVFLFFITGCGAEKKAEKPEHIRYDFVFRRHIPDMAGVDAAEWKDRIVIAGADNLYTIDRKSLKREEINNQILKRSKITGLYSIGESLYISTTKGIAKYNGSFYMTSMDKVNSLIYDGSSMYLATDGGFYSSSTGLSSLDLYDETNSFLREYIENPDLSVRLKKINTLAYHDGKYYFGSDEGLAVTDNTFEEARFYFGDYIVPSLSNELITHKGNSPIAGNIINDIKVRGDEVWIATNSGLSVWTEETGSWKNYTADHTERVRKDDEWHETQIRGNSELEGNYVRRLIPFNEFMIVATTSGLSIIDAEKRIFSKSFFTAPLYNIALVDELLFIFTEFDGLYIFEYSEVSDEDSDR